MHLRRLLAPKFWKVEKKRSKWVVSPRPGPHKKEECIPLLIIIRDILRLAETAKEAKSIIKRGEIKVDGRVVKDHAFPVGLMDVVSIPKIGKSYRVILTKKGLGLVEVKDDKLKICKIVGKRLVKGGKIQISLHDGRNLLPDENKYKTGDSVLIELPHQKLIDHLKLEKGNLVLILSGKNRGEVGVIKKIIERRFMTERGKVICKVKDKEKEVLKEHTFVIGREKPLVEVGV